jgi:hypothetical protein
MVILSIRATFIGGLRDGLIVAECAFLAGAALVSAMPARGDAPGRRLDSPAGGSRLVYQTP